jgi:hypothetical protein
VERSSRGNYLLGLRDTYIDTKVVKDAESPFTFRKGEILILLLGLGLGKYPLLFCLHRADGI